MNRKAIASRREREGKRSKGKEQEAFLGVLRRFG